MYQLMVKREFVSQHYLTVPDAGAENEWHSHHFTVEVILEGETLNEYGYLVDIDDVKSSLNALVDRYRDNTLNDLAEFDGLNPSIEHFSRLFCYRLAEAVEAANLEAITVRMWEDDVAWASYRSELDMV